MKYLSISASKYIGLGAIALAVSMLAACSGGSGGGTVSASDTSTFAGVVSKGLVRGGTACVFAVSNGLKGAQIGSCITTGSDGSFSLSGTPPSGPVLVEVTGGTYVDEATGTTVTLTTPLRSVVVSPSAKNTLAVTPLTEIAVRLALASSGGITQANFSQAVTKVQNNFGVVDILGTMPVDGRNVPASSTEAQRAYTLALSSVSHLLNGSGPNASVASVMSELQACLADPANSCGSGSTSVATRLSTAASAAVNQNTLFAGIQLPVKAFGTVSTAPNMKSLAVSVVSAVPDGSCANGGITVLSGIDLNGNGKLDASEGTNAQIVCNGLDGTNGTDGTNGAPGLNGINALVSVSAEAAGTNCTSGGTRVIAGLDANRNNTLDAAEISSTSYVCNGTSSGSGTNGTNGTNGLNTLALAKPELAGTNCPFGGVQFTTGLDANGNTILDAAEVSSTAYACSPSGSATAVSGRVVELGYVLGSKVTLDINDDRICDAEEPTATTNAQGGYFFDPSLGSHLMCARGGVDVATLRPAFSVLLAPTSASYVTPLTSLVAAKLNADMPQQVNGLASAPKAADISTANSALATKLGIPSVNLLTTDPVAVAGTNPSVLNSSAAAQTLIGLVGTGTAEATYGSTQALYLVGQQTVGSALLASSGIDRTNSASLETSIKSITSDAFKRTVDISNADGVLRIAQVASGISGSGSSSSWAMPSLRSDYLAALATPVASKLTTAIASADAAQFAGNGTANTLLDAASQHVSTMLNLIEEQQVGLRTPSSTFSCPGCLGLSQMATRGEEAVGLLTQAVANTPNMLYLDVASLNINGAPVSNPTANPSLNKVTVLGPLASVSMRLTGTPVTTTGSANILVTRQGDGKQLQLVIDKVTIETINSKPKLTIPADAKLYASMGRSWFASSVTTATFSNVQSLLSTDANGVVSVDMAGLYALAKQGGFYPANGDAFNSNGTFHISMGLRGVPVGVINQAGTGLAYVTNSSRTTFGNHFALGTNFYVEASNQAANTPVVDTNLVLDLTTLKINNNLVTSTSPFDTTGSVTISGAMTTASMQLAGNPLPTRGSALLRVSRANYSDWRDRAEFTAVFDQLDLSMLSGKPQLSVPNTAKLWVQADGGSGGYCSYYSANYYCYGGAHAASFSNVTSLLTTDVNGVARVDMNALINLLKSMDPTNPEWTGFSTTGSFDVNLVLQGMPVAIKSGSNVTTPATWSGYWYVGGYGSISGSGTSFRVNVQ